MSEYFFCYNKRVSDYLNKKGVKYITVALDPKTNKMFSLYKADEKFQEAFDEYKMITK